MKENYILALDQGTAGSRVFLFVLEELAANNPDEYGKIIKENFAMSYESG